MKTIMIKNKCINYNDKINKNSINHYHNKNGSDHNNKQRLTNKYSV